MNKIILHIIDTEIIIKVNKNPVETILTNISYGRITNYNIFLKEFEKFLKDKKLYRLFSQDEIHIITNDYYNESDINAIKNILKELNFIKTTFYKESALIEKENKNIIIDEDSIRIFQKDMTIYLIPNNINLLNIDKKDSTIVVSDYTNKSTLNYQKNIYKNIYPQNYLVDKLSTNNGQ